MSHKTYLNLSSIALAVAGLMFALFPILRPWQDAAGTAEGLVAAAASSWWIPSHLFSALGFILLAFASTAVLSVLVNSKGAAPARWMTVLAILGTGLLLPFYGAESIGLNAIALSGALDGATPKHTLMEAVRTDVYALSSFAAGLLAVAAAGVLLAVAVRRSGKGSAFPAIATAVTLAVYLPQFLGPPWLRIAHGVLLGVSLIALAWWHHTVQQNQR